MQWLYQVSLLGALLFSLPSQAAVLTPERLLTAPRPGQGIANPSGSRALVGCKTFSFEEDKFDSVLYHIDLPTQHELQNAEPTEPLSDYLNAISYNTSSGFWLTDDVAAYVDSTSNTLFAKDVSSSAAISQGWISVGELPASVDTVQVTKRGKGAITIVFSAQVYGDGDIYSVKKHDESKAVKEWERVKVYDSLFVRHWDRWLYPGKRSQLFAVDVNTEGPLSDWSLHGHVRNLLKGTTLEAPVPPFGDEGDYAVSKTHVVFTSKDPESNPAWHTKQNIYIVDLSGKSPPSRFSNGKHGATSSPTFSPDGSKVAWLQMDRDGFESDIRRIYIADLHGSAKESIILENWRLSPSSIQFSADGLSLIGIVEDAEQKLIFEVPIDSTAKAGAKMLSGFGGASSVTSLRHGIFFSASSLLGPTDLYFISNGRRNSIRLTNFGQRMGSSLAGINLGTEPEQFSFPGAGGRTSHGWIHYPPGYDDSKSYPLVSLIHGGPESSFDNSWSTRWNPAVFAAKGFFVITINPAGSSGFGQAYQEEILGQWGGAPFQDIRAGVKHTLERFDNIDPDRVVAAGASYGGYMMNWIQGHNEDKLFKGLVCHDGVFSTLSTYYSTDELYFPFFEFEGLPWENRRNYEKWSPEQYTHRWETPQLTVAGGRDYRLPESEGISVFNTLQRRGVPSRLVYFPDESHWVLEPKNSLRWHEEVLGWLMKYSARKDSKKISTPPSLVFQ